MSTAKKRLIAGFWATALGPLVTLLVQVVSVPVFLHSWGAALYGEWLMMSAVPAYLSMSDMGFGSVAGNDMALRVAAGDFSGALETFQSTWIFVLGVSMIAGGLACAVIWATPLASWLQGTLPAQEARLILILFCLYALGILQASILLSGFRSDGQYPLGALATNLIRLAESAASLLLLVYHTSPLRVAFAITLIRCLATVLVAILLTYKLRWIRFGFAHATWRRVRQLARPALAFMAFPIGNATSIQGMTVLIGLLMGPVAVATFSPMRTLSRFPYQVIDAVKNAVWPELSSAYGAQNWELARRLHRSSCQAAFGFAVSAVAVLSFAGPYVFRLWTRGRLTMNVDCFDVLLLIVVASSFWNTSSAVSLAANRHEMLALQYMAGTSASLLLGYFLLGKFALTGAALSLLLCDVWMSCFVVRSSNRLLQDHTAEFFRSMVQLRGFRELAERSGG